MLIRGQGLSLATDRHRWELAASGGAGARSVRVRGPAAIRTCSWAAPRTDSRDTVDCARAVRWLGAVPVWGGRLGCVGWALRGGRMRLPLWDCFGRLKLPAGSERVARSGGL
eukprot:2289876-Prymnesium_polylepis.2